MCVGVGYWTSSQNNIDPYAHTNLIGLGHGEADTNFKIFWGGSVPQPPIDLGANFPCNTSGVDVYDLSLFAPPGAGIVHYEVARLNTGHVATGTLSGPPGIALPGQTTLLSYQYAWRSNHTTAASVAWDIMSDYVETDF
ncbi:hypothetical protein ACEYYA_14865 [Paracoccus sp. p3-h83]|uniref:hypothetical protein n=1 Tax=Paracoccus sp. p3-h83 TaxID=3342805 RepID=UPI0035B87BD2